MAEKLLEELQIETVFTIPILGGIPIFESVVVSWIVMAVLVILCIWLTHGLTVRNPGRRQIVAESLVKWLDSFMEGMLSSHGKQYGEYLTAVLLFIGLSNIMGIFGFKPPTKDLNVTAALALMSIVLIEVAGIRAKGGKGWLKSFTEPIAIVTPINILEVAIKPLSLCMRLFGNVLGAYVIMEMIEIIMPVVLPMVFSLYFDLFDGFIQAYVFVFLTALFIQEAIEISPSKPKKKKEKRRIRKAEKEISFQAESYQ